MSSTSESSPELLRLLITIFGIFFGGWWTNLFIDVFGSSSIFMLNKAMYSFYIVIPFVSFYLALYVKSWRIQAVIFAGFDGMDVVGTVNMLFPNPIVTGEAFVMKAAMALMSLGFLQILVVHYLKLAFRKSSDTKTGLPLPPPPPPPVRSLYDRSRVFFRRKG